MVNIEIKKVGKVKGDILWLCGDFVKVTYIKKFWFFFKRKKTEMFHRTEILNFKEIYASDYVVNIIAHHIKIIS